MVVNGHQVRVGKRGGPNDGLALIDGSMAVPLEVCSLAAGRDAWMRQIPVKCRECGAEFKLADSDSSDHCQDCMDRLGEENRIADGGAP
jgi:hypothetical protein